MKQKPLPEKQKPTRCASGSIVPNSSRRATPAITANITHAANAANIMRPVNIANIPNISRASNNANIANISNAAKFTPVAHKACLSFAPGFLALLPVLEALVQESLWFRILCRTLGSFFCFWNVAFKL